MHVRVGTLLCNFNNSNKILEPKPNKTKHTTNINIKNNYEGLHIGNNITHKDNVSSVNLCETCSTLFDTQFEVGAVNPTVAYG